MDYPLLVEKILKNTDPSHPDYYFLQKALKMSKNLCEQVNEGTRHKENTERLEWLQIHVDSAKNPGLYSNFSKANEQKQSKYSFTPNIYVIE